MFQNAFIRFFKNYFNFSGRATRSEFWCVIPVLFAIYMLGMTGLVGHPLLGVAYYLLIVFLIIPGLSLFVRRLHDVGYSEWRLFAWWIMLPFLYSGFPVMLGLGPVPQIWIHLVYFVLMGYGLVLAAWPGRND